MQMPETRRKVYVDVVVKHDKEGKKTPLAIVFEDGQRYEVDQLRERRRAAATKVGGTGIRYTVKISGHETFLFEDEDMWFVEAK